LGVRPPQCLEEERDGEGDAAVAQVAGPIRMHRPSIGAAFAADDDPVDAGKVQAGQGAKQRLEAEEARGCGCGSQGVGAADVVVALDGGAKPDVGKGPLAHEVNLVAWGQPAGVVLDQAAEVDAGQVPTAAAARAVQDLLVALWPLGQHLVGVLRRERHHRPHLGDEGGRHPGMQQVAMLSTKTFLGLRQRSGSSSASGCNVTPNPGPDVRGSPSVWYFDCPMALSRPASVRA
jgi:hypothetical protein